MTKRHDRLPAQIDALSDKVRSWSEGDQEDLFAFACEIEARRTGVYVLSEDERSAIDAARRGRFACDDEIEAFWKRHGLA